MAAKAADKSTKETAEQMSEEWRFVRGTRRYKVSDTGRIIDVETREILPYFKVNGVVCVDIDGADLTVLRLVYEAFVGDIPEGWTVRRRDNHKEILNRYNLMLVDDQPKTRKARGIAIRHINTGNVYKSYREAGRATGLGKSSIAKVIDGTLKSSMGHKFEIVKEVA